MALKQNTKRNQKGQKKKGGVKKKRNEEELQKQQNGHEYTPINNYFKYK